MRYVLEVAPASGARRRGLGLAERRAVRSLREHFPDIEWLGNFVTGPHRFVQVFRAADARGAARVADWVHRKGLHAEVWSLRGRRP